VSGSMILSPASLRKKSCRPCPEMGRAISSVASAPLLESNGVIISEEPLRRCPSLSSLGIGELDCEIQIPSTVMPLWIALTPNGMSWLFRDSTICPLFLSSWILVRFSSSTSSCLLTSLFVHNSLRYPAAKTPRIARPRT